jgi:hypothetical protein
VPPGYQVLKVLIASPGDAAAGREAVERALHTWNDHRSDREGLILRPLMWETGSIPVLGRGDAQSVINSQLVDEADIVIALFYHRLGSATPRAVSGTAEEINRSVDAGKLVHLYFAQKDVPHGFDIDQYKAMQEFKNQIQQRGLIGSFQSEEQLHRLVYQAIEYDIAQLKGSSESTIRKVAPVPSPPPNGLTHAPSTESASAQDRKSEPGQLLEPAQRRTPAGEARRPAHSEAPNKGAKEHRVPVIVAIIAAAATITAAVIGAVAQQGNGAQGGSGDAASPSSSSPRLNPTYLLDLPWRIEPWQNKDQVIPGLAVISDNRFPHSFTQNICNDTSVDIWLEGDAYSTLKGSVAALSNQRPITINIFYTDDIDAPWILLNAFELAPSELRPLSEALPPDTHDLRLQAKGDCAGGKVIWADPVVR